MLSVAHKPIMLSFANKRIMLSVFMLTVVMLNVVTPSIMFIICLWLNHIHRRPREVDQQVDSKANPGCRK
jgi:hypothetical protein